MHKRTTLLHSLKRVSLMLALLTGAGAASAAASCNTMYALVDGNQDVKGHSIYPLSETNVLGTKVAELPGGLTSATLAVSPDGRYFYTAADTTNQLWIYDTSTAKWTGGGTFSGVYSRLIRMTVTPNGTGYAMDAQGQMWSFTSGGSVTSLGTFTKTSASGTSPSFYENGDFFAAADGKLYMISADYQYTGTALTSLWYMNPATRTAEYLGDLSNTTGVSQYGGLAATPNGIYAGYFRGILAKVDPQNMTITQAGQTNAAAGSTDLASCYYPGSIVKVGGVKSVKKVAGSAGTDVHPGDTLEYSIVVSNTGNIAAGAVTFQDALPAGTTYVPDSARVNGFATTVTNGTTTSLSGSAYPFATSVGICSQSTTACTTQVLEPDSTPGTVDNEAVITFRVTVNSGVSSVSNQGIIRYNDGTANPAPIPTNRVDTLVLPQPQLSIAKTGNGPWTLGQGGATYTLTVKNTGTVATSGTITVKDLLPAGVTANSLTLPSGWTSSVSGQTVTLTTGNVLAAGASVDLIVPVSIGAGTAQSITNKAVVGGGGDPDAIPDPATCTVGTASPQNQCASYTTTVQPPVGGTCTTMYALVDGNNDVLGKTIYPLSETNVLGTKVADLPYDSTLGKNITSATLAVSPDGRYFYTAADTTNQLWIYDSTTGAWRAGSVFSGVDGRLIRMGVTPSGTGYAMDSKGNLWSFSPSGSTTALGKLKAASASGTAPSFYENGDFFSTSDGKLYMISADYQYSGGAFTSLWYVDPTTMTAEYLGDPSNSTGVSQYGGLAAMPGGVYAGYYRGILAKIDLQNMTMSQAGQTNAAAGSTDLTSCYYPVHSANVGATKSVKKVAGSTGTAVYPGDTLEYTIVVRNSGNLAAGGVTLRDALPAGTTYVPDSARVNGFTTTVTSGTTTSLAGTAYPFAGPVGLCSPSGAACTTQVLKPDTTPGTLDNEAVVTFRVTVNDPFTLSPSQVSNQATVNYTGGPNGGTPSNETVTPVVKPARLNVMKTVQNITAGTAPGTVGEGNPGDTLEYCIATTNTGSANATRITFTDLVPVNTNFKPNGFGPGQDIRVTSSSGTTYLTAAQDADTGSLLNGKVVVNDPTFVLVPQQTFTVCFRTTIK